eukprot:SAG31_NODE_22307_length_528_cov_4.284382_2_plen_116_part_01
MRNSVVHAGDDSGQLADGSVALASEAVCRNLSSCPWVGTLCCCAAVHQCDWLNSIDRLQCLDSCGTCPDDPSLIAYYEQVQCHLFSVSDEFPRNAQSECRNQDFDSDCTVRCQTGY